MKIDKRKYNKLEKHIFTTLVLFSVVLTGVYLIVDSLYSSNQFKDIVLKNATTKINEREEYLQKFLAESKVELEGLKNSKIFTDYINQQNDTYIYDMFFNIALNDSNIMQIRYIDKSGKELIRVDREKQNSTPIIVEETDLQNKASRYYFTNSLKKESEVWFSKLDLNVENNQVQVPFQATLRGILPLTKDGSFDGILIINYFMNDFLDSYLKDNSYDSILADGDGFVLVHHDKEKSWERYQNKNKKESILDIESFDSISYDFTQNKDFISKKLDLEIENELFLILRLNHEYIEEEEANYLLTKLFMFTFILVFSIIVIYYISKELKRSIFHFGEIKKHAELVDDIIIISTTDLQGRIIYASKAFCKISGFEEKELLGKKHNIVKHPEEDPKKHKELWETILNGGVWGGELKNKTKDGKTYWVHSKIHPIYDSKNKKIGYTSLRHDITDKKLIEEISIRDALTNLYNRRHYKEFLPKIINGAKRKDELATFLMIDIDFFKQYNDTYGHDAGDEVIKSIANVFKASLKRFNDYAFRIGGEEFAIVFLPKDLEEAKIVAEKIRNDIEELKIPHSKNKASQYVTASIGACFVEAKNIKDAHELYKNADNLLYKAKDEGRNRVKFD